VLLFSNKSKKSYLLCGVTLEILREPQLRGRPNKRQHKTIPDGVNPDVQQATASTPIEANSLRQVLKEIRNYLAGRATGMTRDESLLIELIKILFCKIFAERSDKKDHRLFFATNSENPDEISRRLKLLFDTVCKNFSGVFEHYDGLKLDDESLAYVVRKLQGFDVLTLSRDPVGDAFEIFVNSTLRGSEGQFFTPRNAIELLVGMCNPKFGDRILDPACGSGSFLVTAAKYIQMGSSISAKEAASGLFGVDKDKFLSFIGKAHLTLLADHPVPVVCENSLLRFEDYSPEMTNWFFENSFDVILTNPPYGADIVVGDERLRGQYDLAFKWSHSKGSTSYHRTDTLQGNPSPQIIFLERCLKLLKPGGRCGVVLPESLFCNPSYGHVTQYMLLNSRIKAVVSFPESLFKTSGKTGTHTKTVGVVFEKLQPTCSSDENIFFADAKWCGHDSRGNEIPFDDLPKILENYHRMGASKPQEEKRDHLGFFVKKGSIRNGILLPKFYDPEIQMDLDRLRSTHQLIRFGDLVDQGVLDIRTGDEVGKLAYGTGTIPFVRTSDISNWEIKLDAKQGVSQEHHDRLAVKQNVAPNDILMVRDGTYLVGTTALVTKHDLPLLYQSHIYKIRVKDESKINPYLLLAILSCPLVQRQIQSFKFTQDIIDTLGNRINDLVLPIPRDHQLEHKVINDVSEAIHARTVGREAARKARLEVIGLA